MLSKATKFSRFCEIQRRFAYHIFANDEPLSASIWRKLFWYFALTETNTEHLLSKLDDVVPLPRRRGRRKRIKSVYEVIPSALNVSEKSHLCSPEDYCARSDYLPDSFISGFGGKYWTVDSWESTGIYSSDYDFSESFFTDFFSRYKDKRVTEKNLPEFWDNIYYFLTEFIPEDSLEPVIKHLKERVQKKPDLIFRYEDSTGDSLIESDNQVQLFGDDFGAVILEEVISYLRFNSTDEARKAVVSGMKALYPFQDISDEEIYRIYKALYDQPLMVQFADCSQAGLSEYVVLVSKSLGYFYSHKDDYSSLKLSEEIIKELSVFYEKLGEIEVVFPYCKFGGADIDTYCSSNIYVAGCYPNFGDYYSYNESVDITIPSLPDTAILQWADELYEQILNEKKGECA